jgi:hypothetical protein
MVLDAEVDNEPAVRVGTLDLVAGVGKKKAEIIGFAFREDELEG